MSVDAPPSTARLTGAPELSRRRTRGAVVDRVRAASLPLQAFAVSRALVLVAGAAGVVRLTSHASRAAIVATVHQMGPVGYLLSASVDRFDAGFYLAIAAHGYGSPGSGRLAFYPVYPLLIRGVGFIVSSPMVAGAAISALAFLAALVMLHRLTELELGRGAADATVLLVAFAPLTLFFSAVYTESLFMMLTVGSLLAARRGHWRLACALAAAGTLTRVTGIALAVGLAIMRIRQAGRIDRSLAWLAVMPATFAGYMAVLAADGYPPLAVFSSEGEWHRVLVGPLGGLLGGVVAAARGVGRLLGGAPVYEFHEAVALAPAAENVVLMLVLALALVALLACWRSLPHEYAAYAAVVLMLCLSDPIPGEPLASADRFILTIFPLWMAAGAWVARRRLEPLAVVLGSGALIFYTMQVASYAFVA